MAELPPNVRLNLSNTAENVVLVREMLAGVAQATEMDGGELLDDVRTAVTEACNNVVLHAYGGKSGPMEIEVHITQGTLEIVVRDHGDGIRAQPEDTDGSPGGIGLHVIRTLAHSVQFKQAIHGGTDVCMEFAIPGMKALEVHPDVLDPQTFSPPQAPTTTTLNIAPITLARAVLPRLVSALAARAHFSTDRISDAQLLADALVAHADGAMSGDHLSIGVDVEPRNIELRISPLSAGRAQRLIGDSALDGLGRVIEKLTDNHRVVTEGSHEMLALELVDRH